MFISLSFLTECHVTSSSHLLPFFPLRDRLYPQPESQNQSFPSQIAFVRCLVTVTEKVDVTLPFHFVGFLVLILNQVLRSPQGLKPTLAHENPTVNTTYPTMHDLSLLCDISCRTHGLLVLSHSSGGGGWGRFTEKVIAKHQALKGKEARGSAGRRTEHSCSVGESRGRGRSGAHSSGRTGERP